MLPGVTLAGQKRHPNHHLKARLPAGRAVLDRVDATILQSLTRGSRPRPYNKSANMSCAAGPGGAGNSIYNKKSDLRQLRPLAADNCAVFAPKLSRKRI